MEIKKAMQKAEYFVKLISIQNAQKFTFITLHTTLHSKQFMNVQGNQCVAEKKWKFITSARSLHTDVDLQRFTIQAYINKVGQQAHMHPVAETSFSPKMAQKETPREH